MNDPEFDECRGCACLSARIDAQRLTRAFDARLRPHGLTINQFSMLARLALAGPATLTGLANGLGVDRTTMTRNLALSEKRGLVRSGRGGRERIVEITPAGAALARAALPAWREAQAAALAHGGPPGG